MFKKPYQKKKKKKLPINIIFHLSYDFHYISFNYLFRSNDTVYGFLRLLSDVTAVNVQRPSTDTTVGRRRAVINRECSPVKSVLC